MKRTVLVICAVICLAAPVFAAQPTADSPQGLYLQAGKEERSGSPAKAREIYESIIDRFPESEFAVKANDRLLSLSSAKQKNESSPIEPSIPTFRSEPQAPLPTQPLLRKGVEAVRLKEKAEIVEREEYDRLKRVDEARDGHKLNRAKFSDKEKAWDKGAADKVLKELGSSLEEISAKAEAACREAGVKGKCSEENLNKLTVQ